MNNLIKKGVAVAVILLFVSVSVIPSTGTTVVKHITIPNSNGNTLYVGGSGPGNYTKIQDAIDDASDGDTVFVFNGTYVENLVVDKSINLVGEDRNITIIDGDGGTGTKVLVSIENASDGDTVFVYNGNYQEGRIAIHKAIMLLGENKASTHIDGQFSNGTGILVISSDVTIREFTLVNCLKDGFGQAIYLWGNPYIENICISDCIMENNDKGIFFININNLNVSSCHFHHNPGQSILGCEDSSNIIINNCLIHNNGKDLGGGWFRGGGISFSSSENERFSNINISDCDIYENYCWGINIRLEETENVVIYNNNIHKNIHDGIRCCRIKNLEIHENYVFDNTYHGVFVENSENVNIYENFIIRNGKFDDNYYESNTGIGLVSITSLALYNNTIIYNIGWGIGGRSCDSSFIYGNNITDNTYGIYLITSNNNIISDNFIQKSEYGILFHTDSSFNTISGNLISKNINGTFLTYSGKNIISGNNISENVIGIYLYEVEFISQYFCNHKIDFNNFIDNNRDVFFRIVTHGFRDIFKTFNKWRNNYWGEPRYIPKPIFGTLRLIHLPLPTFPWVQFDWRPAKEPYDIGV